MGRKSLLRVGYLLMAVQGLLSVVAPKKAIKSANAWLRFNYENAGDLEPRDWYVEVTKIVGVGLLAAGLTGLLVTDAENAATERAAAAADAEAEAEESSVETDDEDEDENGGPVQVEIEDDE